MPMDLEGIVCDGVQLTDLVDAIRQDIGCDWKLLGRELKLTNTEIDAIEYDNRLSLKEQIYQLFHKWQRAKGQEATCKVLIKALKAAKLDHILESLKKKRIIEYTGTGYPVQETSKQPKWPIQETPLGPERPKLIGGAADDHVEPDKTRKNVAVQPVAKSPEEERRHADRVKRLARLSSDKTHEGPFGEGSVVKVDKVGCGVVRWLGIVKSGNSELLSAGIEFEEHVPGGHSGEFQGVKHFSCDPGHGLYLPYERLKKDDRFQTDDTPVAVDQPKPCERLNRFQADDSSISVDQAKPSSQSTIDDTELAQRSLVNRNDSSSNEDSLCKYPGCSKQKYVDETTGLTHDFCNKTHAKMFLEEISDTAPSKPLVFFIPNDHAGLVIGKGGKNILEVERATNTIIRLEDQQFSRLSSQRRGVIKGSEENKKKAVLMIFEKLKHKVSRHTAASETIAVPYNKVGQIIGKNGVTIEAIKQLSGAHDIIFSERSKGLEALMNPNRDCTITGSRDEIEAAKKLINQAIAGEDDIVTSALMASKLAGLSFDDESSCAVS